MNFLQRCKTCSLAQICKKFDDNLFKIFRPSSHVNGNALDEEEEEEETEEDLEVEEEEIPAKPLKVENNMNARRWKWEVLDD